MTPTLPILAREGDPERFRAAMLAPPEKREGLFALIAFNLELAKIAPLVSEVMLGEIRLQWWRETLDLIRDGKVRSHEVAEPLARALNDGMSRAPLDRMIDARGADLDPAFPANVSALHTYLRETAGALCAAAGVYLSPSADPAALSDAGFAIGAARWLTALPHLAAEGQPLPGAINWYAVRDGKPDAALTEAARALAAEGLAALDRARATGLERKVVPATLPATTAERILRGALTADPLTISDPASPFRARLSDLWHGVVLRRV